MKLACVVRTSSDVSDARKRFEEPILFCANDEIYKHCKQKGYSCDLFDDDIVKDEFGPITTWGYRKTLSFVNQFKADKKKYIFFESNFLYIEALFVQILKNSIALDRIFNRWEIKQLYIYDDGQSLLAILLTHLTQLLRSDIQPQLIKPEASAKTGSRKSIKRIIARQIGPIINLINYPRLFWLHLKKAKIVLASGALEHLSDTLVCLKNKHQLKVVYAEDDFTYHKFKFCLKNRFVYIILKKSSGIYNPFQETPFSFGPTEHVYKGVNYSELYTRVFNDFFKFGAIKFPYDYQSFINFFSNFRFSAVLVDEDIALRRIFSLLSDWKAFVISHGIPGAIQDESGQDLRAQYPSGIVFASGQFEKLEYERLYYDPKKVMAVGVPRYDHVYRLKKTPYISGDKKRVLHCGSSMRRFGFEDLLPWLGLKVFLAQHSEVYLKDLLDIVGHDKQAILQIKPHYSQEDQWMKCIQEDVNKNLPYQLLSHKQDVFALERQSDVVVTVESSVICEAIMLDKPVILLNYTTEGLFSDYEKYSLVEHVRNKEELAQALHRSLYDQKYLEDLAERRKKYFEYYCHQFDGKYTQNVASVIASYALTGKLEGQNV